MTMIGKSNKQYANIRTMQELRSARERLSWQIESSERDMERQYEGLREMFTFAYLSGIVVRKMESIRSWVGSMYDGYRLVMSLFTKRDEPQVEEFVEPELEPKQESKLEPKQKKEPCQEPCAVQDNM